MYDYHLHSINSADGSLTIDEVCRQAIKMGFKEIAITDHLDYDVPGKEDFLLDYESYTKEIEEAKEKYQGIINIVKGLEIGFQPHVRDKNNNFITKHQFDFVIGSVHNINGLGLFNEDYYQEKTRKNAYTTYLQQVEFMVEKFPYFHVVGHLDVIRRFPGYSDRTMSIPEFKNQLEAILIKLIDSGKGIEVNSSGFRFGLNDTLPTLDVVKRYRELGGEIITVGSDGHRIHSIGSRIEEAFWVLKQAGFNYVCLFRNGKPFKVDLP